MSVLGISKEQGANFYRLAAKIGTIGGGLMTATCIILEQDYTYPCTVAALSGCAWFSIWLTQSAVVKKDSKMGERSLKEKTKQNMNDGIDGVGALVQERLKIKKNKFIDKSITSSKTAMVTSLPPGINISAATVIDPSLQLTGRSLKGVSDKSLEYSTYSTGKIIKGSTSWLINKS